MQVEPHAGPLLSSRSKLTIVLLVGLLLVVVLLQIRQILSPFLWAFLAAYLLTPVVNYFNVRGGLPRIWAVLLVYGVIALLLIAGSRYLYPKIVEQGTVFLEDLPRLEAALIGIVGPQPLGINIDNLVSQLAGTGTGVTGNANTASHLIVNALETFFKFFLFAVATFYLLMDGRRLKGTAANAIPPAYRPEILALGRKINLTWQQYIRGELLLFVMMALVTTIGLEILGVPGAIFLGLMSGALELLPLVGPLIAGTLAVSVAYFNGTNQWGWSQIAYAGAVAGMYFVLRQSEDYFVMPHVLGRAVRLHPLVVLFALTASGIVGGLFGLVIAVPLAASLKAIFSYLNAKLFDLPIEFEPVRTITGTVIEIPVHANAGFSNEGTAAQGPGTP